MKHPNKVRVKKLLLFHLLLTKQFLHDDKLKILPCLLQKKQASTGSMQNVSGIYSSHSKNIIYA